MGGDGEAKARSKDEVLAGIAKARDQITWSAQALRTEVATRMDWREQVRRNPWWFMVGAFTFGLWLGQRRR